MLRNLIAFFDARTHHSPPACPWLADTLQFLQREHRAIARAAHSVVSGAGQESLEDLLCRAEGVGERLADLCERVAAIAALRALQARSVRRDDPGAPA